MVIVSVQYIFAIVGMELFAGRLDILNPDVAASAYGNDGFGTLSFDSLAESYVVLFYQLVVNNWVVIVDGLSAAFQSRWPRLYFILFYIVTVVIVLNMLLAFIIESFSIQKQRRERARLFFGRKALRRLDRLQRLLVRLKEAKTAASGDSAAAEQKARLLADRIADATSELARGHEYSVITVDSHDLNSDPDGIPMPRRLSQADMRKRRPQAQSTENAIARIPFREETEGSGKRMDADSLDSICIDDDDGEDDDDDAAVASGNMFAP